MLLLHLWGGQGMGAWGRSSACVPPHCRRCCKTIQPPVPVSARLMGARANYTPDIHASFIRETHLLQNFEIPRQAVAFLAEITQKNAKPQVLQHSPSPPAPGIVRDAPPFPEMYSYVQRCAPIFGDPLLFSEMHSYFQERISISRHAPPFPEAYPPIFRDTPLFPHTHTPFAEMHPYFQRFIPIFRDPMHFQGHIPTFRYSPIFRVRHLPF